MFGTKDRVDRYREEVKTVWNERYDRHIWKAVHQARSEEDNRKLAVKDLNLFLFPEQRKCENLHDSIPEEHNIVPTFSKDFWKHHKLITDYLPNLKQCDALDYGCGSLVRYTTELAKLFRNVVGVDVSSRAIQHSRRYTEGINNISIIEVDGVNLCQFRDYKFDFVFSNLVFQHIGNKEIMINLINEIYRILTPRGIFRASFWTEEKPDDFESAYDGTGFSIEGYKEVFQKAGFQVEGISHQYPVLWITAMKMMNW